MPIPRLCWGIGIKLDVETPLQGHTPEGSGNCAKGATVPTLQEMQHAGELCLPKTQPHKGVCNGHGKMTIQQEAVVASALALRCQFTVQKDALEKVEVFKYLGRMMAQDNNDVQAMQHQLRKARGTLACIGQMLRSENVTPRVAAKFYKAVVQALLLYGSKTWNRTKAVLARLEGFHV
jgi:hypothetical protein